MFKKIAPLALASLLLMAGPTGTAFAEGSVTVDGNNVTDTNPNPGTNAEEPNYGGSFDSDINVGWKPDDEKKPDTKPDPGPDTKPEIVIPDGNNGGKEEPVVTPEVEQPEDDGQKDTATKETKPAEKQADKATLPQTGEANSTNVALLGLTLIALGTGAFVFTKQGSRKNYEK